MNKPTLYKGFAWVVGAVVLSGMILPVGVLGSSRGTDSISKYGISESFTQTISDTIRDFSVSGGRKGGGGGSGVTKPAYDLDVAYIERTPRYYRYCVTGMTVPQVCGAYKNAKQWPSVGETVTYTAHVINKGSGTIRSSFDYEWFVDGASVKTGSYSQRFSSQQEITFSYQMPWVDAKQTIQFRVNTNNAIVDPVSANNILTIGSRDLTFSLWVETGMYAAFNATQNSIGSFSFEDAAQIHFAKMNDQFAKAIYPTAPNGITDRVRIEKVVVADELDSGLFQGTNDPDYYLIDGRWGFADGDVTNTVGRNGGYQVAANQIAKSIDWGLIHELTHQLGIVDLYRMGIMDDNAQTPNGGVNILDINGQVVPRSRLPFPVFQFPGLMGGGDTQPYNNGTYFESHTAGGLQSNAGQRRGFYGDYLFDTPTSTTIRFVDVNGAPLAQAQVWLYQKDTMTEYIDNVAEISGTTNAQGELSLPNRSVQGGTTATGHTLKANPFGQIDIIGRNGGMIIRIDKNGQEGYGFLTLHDLNVAYQSGYKNQATITTKTNYPKISATTSTTP